MSNYNDSDIHEYVAHLPRRLPTNFDIKAYKIFNPDIVRALHKDDVIENHYLMHGRHEERKYEFTKLPNDFTAEIYKKLYPDLQHLTDIQAIAHYENNGFYEKSKYN